jgi:Uma2 family endonuclease
MSTTTDTDRLVLEILPEQGHWSEADYLWLTDHTNRLIEYTDGYIEELATPTDDHQAIIGFLYELLKALVAPAGGVVRFAALRLYVKPRRYREPDILVLLDKNDPRRSNRYWSGADLVVEVVSDDEQSRARDYETKRADYAAGGIPEYWIVDPQEEVVIVLALGPEGTPGAYVEHARGGRGERVASALLPALVVSVDEVFDAV